MSVIWEPQKKQAELQKRSEYEALYGGAAGGGKSDCMLAEALRQVHIPHYRCLILRKTYPQLTELIDRSRELYKMAFPAANYNETSHVWTFPSGAKIFFGSMQHTKDRTQYQGKRYDLIIFDELTHFTWEEYSYMFSRNRPGGPGTRVYMRATANPGGIGHGWVKERFITPAPPMTPIKYNAEIRTPDGKLLTMERKRIFVPSTVFDNQKLLDNDPNYLANLAMLPEAEKNALLYGDWDSFSGQVFTEWRNDPKHYDDQKFTHVIDPFRIPSDWKVIRSFDFGYSRPFSVGWYAVDHVGCMYRIRELYGCTGTPNVGVKWTPQEIAQKILEIEAEDANMYGHKILGIADPAIFEESKGESIATMMERKGIFFEKGEHARIPGKMQIHYRFSFDEDGRSMLYVFKTCRNFIRTIPALVYDETNVEDIDTNGEDHIYDECRYACMEMQISPRKNVLKQVPQDDPLDMFRTDRENDKYSFYRM